MPVPHPLDRPAWSALTTRQAHLAQGNGRALRFDPAYAAFAGAPDESSESLAALAALDPYDAGLWILQAAEAPAPPGMTAAKRAEAVQMVAASLKPALTQFAYEDLTERDAPQMLALALLTEPGPFFARTHQLGKFVGVKDQGRLIAMAGERMKPAGFTEVSGVCTHPDYRGRGYAKGLMSVVAARSVARGDVPFLHAYANNTGAITLYESLGFAIRSAINVAVFKHA